MECNKDEAVRAKELAENNMQNNDFESARKLALKAQALYPELDNITQMLSICNVHTSAQMRILGSEKDWYGILQVEKFADESTVKKQYRRLALILHPDKNRFPGADGAFKLISEANAFLSDPTKKSFYDNRVRISSRFAPINPPTHQMNKNSQLNKQYGAQNNASNGFSSLNHRQTTQPTSSVSQETFWTSCPYCGVKYQYLIHVRNNHLRCQRCYKDFVAHEVSARGVSLGSKQGQSGAPHVPSRPDPSRAPTFQERVVPNQGNCKMGVQNEKGSSAPHTGSQGIATGKTLQPELGVQKGSGFHGIPVANAAKVTGNLNTNEANSLHGGKEGGTSNGDAVHRETGDTRKKGRKRGRKQVVESSESCDTLSQSDQDASHSNNSDTEVCQCPDPEFSDFDKERDESRFQTNQYWACYDTSDNMPRFYAKVKKVSVSPFELSITWLEAEPIDKSYEKWVDEELPVGCGSFRFGNTEKTSARFSFSHQVHCEKGKKRGHLIMYPRQGEVWALFKNWDISWSLNPENHEFKYEVVEVLSNFVEGTGIKVSYLDKITGFVSLFQRCSESETSSFWILPNELYKFSHRVPCFKMTGTERGRVPIGSFELDPASLPMNLDDLYYPGKAKTKHGNLNNGVHCSPPKSAKGKGKSEASEGTSTPKKFVDLEGIQGEMHLRRSPRGLNVN